MPEPDDDRAEPMTTLVRQEWTAFRSRSRLLALTTAVLVTVLLGVLVAAANHSSCSEGPVEVACPTEPVGPAGSTVRDQFTFVHRSLGENGTITVRMTDMTGIITYPPPDHDEIVPGLVPWAKAGIIIKDGVEQGSAYAALMVTGSHGVRMQYGFTEDIAGSPGGVSQSAPRWLRLVRSGDTLTGFESADGARWTEVSTANLPGLPGTVQVGLFAASPGDLTLRPVGLGGSLPELRFTQTTAVFDTVEVTGPAGGWTVSTIGRSGETDWEKFHLAPGLEESGGTFTVTGSGDIAPASPEGGHPVERPLVGLPIAMIILIVLAVRCATGVPARTGRALAARAIVLGSAAFTAGLVAAGVVVAVATTILGTNGIGVLPTPVSTVARVVIGVGALWGVTAVLALALGALARRTWPAVLVAIAAIALPAVLGVLPLLPDGVSDLLLTLTPAAGFAVQQTQPEYPQVLAHYAPSDGYFPLPWWAGFAVLCGYAALALGLAVLSRRGRGTGTGRRRSRQARPRSPRPPAEPATLPGLSG